MPVKTIVLGALVVAVLVALFIRTIGSLVWQVAFRPFAVSRGLIPMTAYDYVVRGWKAEREGRWVDALRDYELAIELNHRYPEGRIRRDHLLANHPELAAHGDNNEP